MKQDRIELRVSKGERARFSEAAAFTGMTLSAFLRQAALEKSENVLQIRNALTLSDRDRDLFLETLENPPKPNKQLQQAFSTYRKLKKNHVNKSPIKRARSKIKRTKMDV